MRWLATLVWVGLIPNVWADSPPYRVGKFPQEVAVSFTTADGLPADEVRRLDIDDQGDVWAKTAAGWAVFREESWSSADPPNPAALPGRVAPAAFEALENVEVRQAARGPAGQLIVAADRGLFQAVGDRFESVTVEDGQGRRWAASDVRGAAFDSQGQLWVATLAGAACQTADGWRFYTGSEGLPYNDFTVVQPGPGGEVWFGTRRGAVLFDGSQWAYRQGRRWLPHDEVRDVAVDRQGRVWFATPGGIGRIERRMMTLAEKAQVYEEEIERYIRRTPYGYVAEVSLAKAGDKQSEVHQHDSDNDGLWTAMYGAGECFAFAATGDPDAKGRAQRAFEALRFLQKVTQGGEHSPPKGYVARTIRSVDLPDPNVGRLERDRRERDRGDALWKVYEPRWPKSADGKWYWKSDTSSDELDGHYFFYPLYYDLVADSEREKDRVREVVRDLTDHLIEHDYNLVDHDGTPTRWGVYSPESLNHDPNWWVERGLKSLSMLSYLAVAQHMTGDPKYGAHINQLVVEHAYDTNAMIYKIHRGLGSGNHSDDEMAFMSYYNLMKYADDPALRDRILLSFHAAWTNEQPEMNPFFNFAYAAHGMGAEVADAWGTHPLTPWDGWLEDSLLTLQGFPLDRLDWGSQNSHRLDIRILPRQNSVREITDVRWPQLGYRENGKVLPVENRHFNHWNTNPWVLDYHGQGRGLASGTVYLLPYYMGLYHGFIEETE